MLSFLVNSTPHPRPGSADVPVGSVSSPLPIPISSFCLLVSDFPSLRTPSKSSHPKPLLSPQHFALISPLDATLMDLPASVANKRLTAIAKPFRCNTYKKPGGGYPQLSHLPLLFKLGPPPRSPCD